MYWILQWLLWQHYQSCYWIKTAHNVNVDQLAKLFFIVIVLVMHCQRTLMYSYLQYQTHWFATRTQLKSAWRSRILPNYHSLEILGRFSISTPRVPIKIISFINSKISIQFIICLLYILKLSDNLLRSCWYNLVFINGNEHWPIGSGSARGRLLGLAAE